jgi:hypothetical protein
MTFPVYATKDDLATFRGPLSTEITDGEYTFLLSRASELVCMATKYSGKTDTEQVLELKKLATCAQVMNWIANGTDVFTNGQMSGYSLGDLTMSFAKAGGSSATLCDMAISYLRFGKLTNRCIRQTYSHDEDWGN